MPIETALRDDAVIPNDRGNYWRYYGLRRDPFAPQTEFYLPPRWEQYFDLLYYLCNSNNVLLSITGVKGSGKTTFMRQFLSQLGENTSVYQLSAKPNFSIEQLNASLIKGFDLPQPAGENWEEKLDSHVEHLQEKSQLCLLVIDDAHRLPEPTMKALLYLIKLQSESQMRLHILLLGEPVLKETLALLVESEGERELVHRVTLEPFTFEETVRYIKHQLVATGLPAAIPLSDGMLERIHNLSEGIPARINSITRQVLIDAMAKPQLYSFFDFVRNRRIQLLGGGIVVLLLLGLSLILSHGHRGLSLKLPSFHTTKTKPQIQEPAAQTAITMPAEVSTAVQPLADHAQQEIVPQNTAQTSLSAIAAAPEPLVQTADTAKPAVQANVEKPSVVTNVAVSSQKPTNVAAAAVTPKPAAVVSKPQAVVPAVKTEAKVANKTVVAHKAVPHHAAIVKVAKKTHESVVKNKVSSSSQQFAIQLIGLSSEAAMKKFIATNGLTSKASYYRTTRKGKSWYILVYGAYPSRKEADTAIAQLPKALQEQYPWVRSMANVKQDMQQG